MGIIKAVLLIFLIGNGVYAGGAYLTGNTEYVGEVFVQTGICAAVNLAVLLGTLLCERMDRRTWEKRIGKETFGDQSFGMVKCSGGYVLFHVLTIGLDLLFAVFLWMIYRSDPQELTEIYRSGGLDTGAAVVVIYNLASAAVFLKYSSYKVLYTRYMFSVVRFMKRETLQWTEIEKIRYECTKKGTERLAFETGRRTVRMRSEQLCDGWGEFCFWVQEMAEEYGLAVEVKR